MITLNLLPYKRRKEIEKQKGDRFVLFFSIVSLLFLFITIILLVTNAMLAKRINNLIVFKASSYDVRNQAEKLNKKIIILNQIQGKFILYVNSLIDFTEVVPPGIRIDELVMDKTSGDIKIQGIASTRDDLIQFQNKLEESERFFEIQFPIENLLAKGQVSFQIVAKVNFSEL